MVRWEPYNPSEWRAYAPRQRWFRTPNDAFLTGNFHVSQSLLQNVLKTQTFSWVQLLLASIYSGAFHPTAEGQAAIADAVVDQSRGVLAKYDGRRRAAERACPSCTPPTTEEPAQGRCSVADSAYWHASCG